MRIDANYRNISSELHILASEDLLIIEGKARCLELNQCYEFLCIDPSDLSDNDASYALKAWKRGRASGITDAGDKLFAAMAARNGGQVSMDYLKALSGTFAAEVSPDGSSSGFSFNVVLPD